MGRSDGRVARALAPAPGSAWETLWLQSAQARRMLLHPVPKCQSKEKDGTGWDGMALCRLELLFRHLPYTQGTAQCLLPDG